MFFHLCEAVQIFQWKSIFCSKISPEDPYLSKISSGGNQFWGVRFYCDSCLLVSTHRTFFTSIALYSCCSFYKWSGYKAILSVPQEMP